MALSYRDAAVALWGEAGEFAHDEYARHRAAYFGDRVPEQVPIVIGITAYAHVTGICRGTWEHGPRISLESRRFHQGRRWVSDTLLHEMIHVALHGDGVSPEHKNEPWYAELRRLWPLVLGQSDTAMISRGSDRKSVRVANPDYTGPGCGEPRTVVRKQRVTDAIPHEAIAGFPHSFRPAGYYDGDQGINCPTY